MRRFFDGSPDTSFGTKGDLLRRSAQMVSYGLAVALQPDGKIVGFGYGVLSQGANPTWGFAAARLNPDGSSDTTFGTNGRLLTPIGTNGQSYGLVVALQADGKIIASGVTDASDGVGDAAIVRYKSYSEVEISGRVTTPEGRGLRNATVGLTDSLGVRRTATTSSFGFYRFDDVRAGESYVVGVSSRLYRFSPKILQANNTLADVDFFDFAGEE